MARSAAARVEESVPAPSRAKRATDAKRRAPRASAAAPAKPRTAWAAAAPAKAKPPSPRRRSGPAAKPKHEPRGTRTAARTAPAPRQPITAAGVRTALAARGNVLLDRLLRGRLWVVCVGFLLAGIVFLNVGLLQLNDRIARTDRASGSIGRENAELRLKLAKLDSTERIQRLAEAKGFVMPAPGAVRYVRSRSRDAREAARKTTAPDPLTPAVPATSTTPVAPGAGTTPSVPATGAPGTPAATQPAAPATTAPPAAAAPPTAATQVP